VPRCNQLTAVAFSDILVFGLGFEGCGLGFEGHGHGLGLGGCGLVNFTACGMVTTTIRLRFDGRSTAYRRSFKVTVT